MKSERTGELFLSMRVLQISGFFHQNNTKDSRILYPFPGLSPSNIKAQYLTDLLDEKTLRHTPRGMCIRGSCQKKENAIKMIDKLLLGNYKFRESDFTPNIDYYRELASSQHPTVLWI